MTVRPTRYPIVLMHGFGAMADAVKGGVFSPIAERLRGAGVDAHAPTVQPYARISQRAATWNGHCRQLLGDGDYAALNLVAFSMGGTRCAVPGQPTRRLPLRGLRDDRLLSPSRHEPRLTRARAADAAPSGRRAPDAAGRAVAVSTVARTGGGRPRRTHPALRPGHVQSPLPRSTPFAISLPKQPLRFFSFFFRSAPCSLTDQVFIQLWRMLGSRRYRVERISNTLRASYR